MPTFSQIITSHSPEETCKLAQQLAPCLDVGDVVLLSGGIGAGKTHFARCFIQALLDVPEDIPSPTFTLVQTYTAKGLEIWHTDLYRLSDVYEIEELGLTEAFETAICLVEWPDRLRNFAPKGALNITLSSTQQDDQRKLHLSWDNQSWGEKLKGLLNAVA
ncbi:tRNA (adenosine(37)-N6)-threonylcarbamoyltransferase complex ATPase subunit type 1 TsaE [Roseovarius sp. EL26]|uniref:tRNA (adenosine(37)-N6)-threonylcarbamoyltransferase complex ATPase subunit type 1 TsaE n=1 Tax=Roseovarius sp. EL26 TaxID=2126672 RepID=UPI000EA14A9B|nr:tRNA (adenosine(37)-N6)-threonylcarbamoyltransferase complex ATPase subunit type 1 TsaE [Roseovarius sp. EL26]